MVVTFCSFTVLRNCLATYSNYRSSNQLNSGRWVSQLSWWKKKSLGAYYTLTTGINNLISQFDYQVKCINQYMPIIKEKGKQKINKQNYALRWYKIVQLYLSDTKICNELMAKISWSVSTQKSVLLMISFGDIFLSEKKKTEFRFLLIVSFVFFYVYILLLQRYW